MRTAIRTVTVMAGLCVACRSSPHSGTPDPAPVLSASARAAPVAVAATEAAPRRAEVSSLPAAYAKALAQLQDLEYPALEREVGIVRSAEKPLSFSVASAKYYPLVKRVLKLTQEEIRLLTRKGLVSVESSAALQHGQRLCLHLWERVTGADHHRLDLARAPSLL